MNGEIRPAFYTVAETAKLLRIGRRQAYDLVASGDIPSRRIGSSIRIPRLELERKYGIDTTLSMV